MSREHDEEMFADVLKGAMERGVDVPKIIADILRTSLPRESPTCTHVWRYSPPHMAWICGNCGYKLSKSEVANIHEGDKP